STAPGSRRPSALSELPRDVELPDGPRPVKGVVDAGELVAGIAEPVPPVVAHLESVRQLARVRPRQLERPEVEGEADTVGGPAVAELVVLRVPELEVPEHALGRIVRVRHEVGDGGVGQDGAESGVEVSVAGAAELAGTEPRGPDVEEHEAPQIPHHPE